MDSLPPPLAFVVLLFAGRVNRQQQAVIDYLLEENRVLRAALGSRRLRLTNDQRRCLAVKGEVLGVLRQNRIRTGSEPRRLRSVLMMSACWDCAGGSSVGERRRSVARTAKGAGVARGQVRQAARRSYRWCSPPTSANTTT